MNDSPLYRIIGHYSIKKPLVKLTGGWVYSTLMLDKVVITFQ